MNQSFPIRESSILSLSELVSRLLGLLFLAHFVKGLGLAESAAFRTALPLIGVAAALGSIGLPQALTRLFAAERGQGTAQGAPHRNGAHLQTAVLVTGCTAVITLMLLHLLLTFTSQTPLLTRELHALLTFTTPLLLLMCVTGSLRGILLGLGHTFAPALAQILEVGCRLVTLLALLPFVLEKKTLSSGHFQLTYGHLHLSGAQVGLFTLTVGEAVAGLFLATLLFRHLRKENIRFPRLALKPHNLRPNLRQALTLLRMSLAPTGQALLASLGYALELPLAHQWLTATHGANEAGRLLAEYAAIALPLLCAPMVLTDGLATALLPAVAAERSGSHSNRDTFPLHTRRVIGAVALVALPVTAAFFVLAPTLCTWFGAPSAADLLILLAPLTLPLFLQAPLSSLLQAQGYSRALLFAGLGGDVARIGGLWLGLVHLQLGATGLALAFTASVLVQGGLLLLMCARLAPVRWPWRTSLHALQVAVIAAALAMTVQRLLP
ncbi:MAG TPA: oligosaccharide flippase family protein [Bacilli bacterium]|nr:oligosaccharide flippase family protein [Bacilli bacterium]